MMAARLTKMARSRLVAPAARSLGLSLVATRGLSASPISRRAQFDLVAQDNTVRSPKADLEVPQVSLYSHVFGNFAQYGKKTAIIDGFSGREYSFNEIDETTAKFSSALNRMGLQKGDVLAICAPNCPEYAVAFFGSLASGVTVSTCNPTYTANELAYQFKNSGSKAVVTVPETLATVQKAAEDAGTEKIIVISSDSARPTSSGVFSYQNLIQDSGSRFSPVSVDPLNDIAVLPYSSGTTGLPKGVELTHYNVVSNICQLNDPDFFDLRGNCLIGVLPYFHIYGMVIILFSSLCQGSKLVSLPKFDPTLFLSTIEKNRVSIAHLVPPLVLFLAKHPEVENYDVSSIADIMSGAAPLGGDLVKSVSERLGCKCVRQGYGLTETSPVTHITPKPSGMAKPDSIGVCVGSMLCRVVDTETGEALPAGKEGELLVKGPNVMKGYLNQREATRKTITEDRWMHTGDVAKFDQEGFFYITDRLKELIKVKGLQVAPAELEALLQCHPKVSDAAVIGVADERLGEAPKAFVVKKDAGVTEKELSEYIARNMAQHKHLAGGVEFIDAVPKSASGKILRRHLKK